MALISSIVNVGVGAIVGVGGTGVNVKVGAAVSVATILAAGTHETKIKATSKTVTMFLIFILRFYNPNLILAKPIQLINETINPPIRGLDLPLQRLLLLPVPMLSRGGNRGLRLCNSSMRSTSETSSSCHAVLGGFCKTVLNLMFPSVTVYIGGRDFGFQTIGLRLSNT